LTFGHGGFTVAKTSVRPAPTGATRTAGARVVFMGGPIFDRNAPADNLSL
jgi:hypothetical protein